MAIEITFSLPDELAEDAREFGLLEPDAFLDVLQAEIDRRVNDLVNEEIHTYRAEKRKQKQSRSE